jgi:hypothetical protein
MPCVFDLTDKIRIYLLNYNPNLLHHFADEKWLALLTYLTDISENLNELNLFPQGRNTNILILSGEALTKKICLWKDELVSGNYEMFPCFAQFVKENEVDFEQVQDIVMTHLTNLQSISLIP